MVKWILSAAISGITLLWQMACLAGSRKLKTVVVMLDPWLCLFVEKRAHAKSILKRTMDFQANKPQGIRPVLRPPSGIL